MNANQARQPTTVGQHPLTSAELLAELEESRNRRLDNELDQLADGFAEIIRAASLHGKDKFQLADEGFALETRAGNILLAAESLMSMVSELKRTFILNDTRALADAVSKRLQSLRAEQQRMRNVLRTITGEMDELLLELEQVYYASPYRYPTSNNANQS